MAGTDDPDCLTSGAVESYRDHETSSDRGAVWHDEVDGPIPARRRQRVLGRRHRPDRVIVQPHHNDQNAVDLRDPVVVDLDLDAYRDWLSAAELLLCLPAW